MNRVLTVAVSEFLALVRTKFFIIGLLMMPVLVGASIAFQVYAARQVDRETRAFAVIDHTGALYEAVERAAGEHNRASGEGAAQTGPRFVPSLVEPDGRPIEEIKIDLSARVKRKDLFAFVEIPADALSLDAPPSSAIEYYTETGSYEALPDWLQTTLNREIAARRFASVAVDPALVAKLTRTTRLSRLSLVERRADGSILPAKRVDALETFALPFGLMYLLFLAVMTTAPQLLNAVIEEKMSRISEVLVASVTPFQLMLGKLVGMAMVSIILAVVYFAGAAYALFYAGRWDILQPAVAAWFLLFLVCAVLMFGSIFLAIGAASSDIKDAQGMMQPAMVLVLVPVFAAPIILRAPDSAISVWASLFPTASPFLMLIRLAMKPGPPAWQVALSVALMLATAALLVWAAGRIFRVGLLMQGKGATLREMIRWIRA